MIYEWKPDPNLHNYGDFMGRLLLPKDLAEQIENRSDVLLAPIGSVINNKVMEYGKYLGKKSLFINCGWDGSSLDPVLLSEAFFFGCRGPITQSELAKFNIAVEVTGDPGYGISHLSSKKPKNSTKVDILVPHGTDQGAFDDVLPPSIELVVSPFVTNKEGFDKVVNQISSSSFVLAGAMHAAITAHALGVPFGLYKSSKTNFIDHPLKWSDWLNSIGVYEVEFYSSVSEAKSWYERNFQKKFYFGKNLSRRFVRNYRPTQIRRVFTKILKET